MKENRKLLRRVGQHWAVVSIAALALIGGGAIVRPDVHAARTVTVRPAQNDQNGYSHQIASETALQNSLSGQLSSLYSRAYDSTSAYTASLQNSYANNSSNVSSIENSAAGDFTNGHRNEWVSLSGSANASLAANPSDHASFSVAADRTETSLASSSVTGNRSLAHDYSAAANAWYSAWNAAVISDVKTSRRSSAQKAQALKHVDRDVNQKLQPLIKKYTRSAVVYMPKGSVNSAYNTYTAAVASASSTAYDALKKGDTAGLISSYQNAAASSVANGALTSARNNYVNSLTNATLGNEVFSGADSYNNRIMAGLASQSSSLNSQIASASGEISSLKAAAADTNKDTAALTDLMNLIGLLESDGII